MYYRDITFLMAPYPISEDTLLLLDSIKCGKRVLEMGTGNGLIAMECARRGSAVTAVDIDLEALKKLDKEAKKQGLSITTVHSDLFEKVTGVFDTIIFNPPYLPGDAEEIEDLQWAGGGEYGDEIIMRFLENAHRFLSENGEIYIVLSSFNRIDLIKSMPYDFEKISELKLSFHTIFVYKLKKCEA